MYVGLGHDTGHEMSVIDQPKPHLRTGPEVEKPINPYVDGFIFASPTTLSVWDSAAGVWRVYGGGGGPPLSNDPPQPVGVTAPGSSPDASRADHVHAHGIQPLGTGMDHALVTPDPGGVAGFMSPLQASQLAALVAALTPPPLFLYVPGVALGDLVTIVAPDTAGKANATSIATMPAIGFVNSFVGATQLTIVMVGTRGGFVGLVPGTSYYVDNAVPGGITSNVTNGNPGDPFVTGNVIQKIGVAINPTTMLVAMGSEDTLGV